MYLDSRCATTKWVRLLDYVTGWADQRLLLQNEYLAAENPYPALTSAFAFALVRSGTSSLAEIGKRAGRKDPQLVAFVALPDPRFWLGIADSLNTQEKG
jgi:hypothetical protein